MNRQTNVVRNNLKIHFMLMRRSERIAWIVVLFQLLVILSHRNPTRNTTSIRGNNSLGNSGGIITTATNPKQLVMNDYTFQHYENIKQKEQGHSSTSYYDIPTIHPEKSGLVSRVWHSNGQPSINPFLKTGSCWCGADEWCMCTAAVAIDCILTSGSEHFWLVKRKDTGQYATMGGFVEVGESSADTVVREMKEEMNVDIPLNKAKLFGVYSDPQRDARRHTVSIVYELEIPEETIAQAGDDAVKVTKVHIDEIPNLDFFADHKTILNDYISQRRGATTLSNIDPIKRNVCLLSE